MKEVVQYGSVMGGIMFISNVIYLGLQKDTDFTMKMLPYLAPFLLGYIAIGVGFFFFYTRKSKKEHWLLQSMMKGMASVYSVGNVIPLIFFVALLFADKTPIRIMLLIDFVIMIGFMILDYQSILKLSQQLNRTYHRTKALLVDLDQKPESVDEFCKEIESYCLKNHISYEFLHWGVPALVKMDGKECKVELESYYSKFGPVYGMKIIEERAENM